MTDELYAYQATAVRHIAQGEAAYLGFDPGLGKSRTALEAAKARRVKRLLVAGPASSRYVWQREAKRWWPEMKFTDFGQAQWINKFLPDGIYFVTYGLLSQRGSPLVERIATGLPFDMTVLDEAAALKNSRANRTKAVFQRMLPKLGYVLPMSGTPAPNHAGELFPVLRAVYPQALVKAHSNGQARSPAASLMNEFEFQDAFCKVVNKRFGGAGRGDVRVIEGSKNVPELKRRMGGFMLRVRKEEVLKDLPPIRWDVVPVEANIPQNFSPALPILNTDFPPDMDDEGLLQWLSGAGGEPVMKLRRLLGMAKLKHSIEFIQEFLENAPPDQKILVFAHHKDVIERLHAGLMDYCPAVITGATPPAIRAKEIDAFLSDPRCRVFIGNILAAGTALTLVGPKCKCSDVFFVEASYSVGDNVQAACRVHRIGQNDAVVARFLCAHGTIDDRIQSILARKAADFHALFG